MGYIIYSQTQLESTGRTCVYEHFAYRITALLSKTFLVWLMELLERSAWRAMAPDTHGLFSDAVVSCVHCKYCKVVYTQITTECATTHDNKLT